METKTKSTSQYGVNDFTRNEKIFNEEVQPRMEELLKLNVPFDWNSKGDRSKEFDKRWDRQRLLIEELEKHAFEAKSMTGRIIRFQCADSYAMYLVIKVNKTTCRLQWLDVGDGWEDARLGDSGSISLNYVHDDICYQDRMKKAFS